MENQLLENEIAVKSSLKQVEKEAKALGFEDAKNVEYLKDLNLALNQ